MYINKKKDIELDININNFNKNNFSNINNIFKIPITYLKKCYKTDENIIKELELINNIQNKKENIPIYNEIFNPNNFLSVLNLEQIVSYYTNNIKFLKESQNLINSINLDIEKNNLNFKKCFEYKENQENEEENKENKENNKIENILDIYNNIKSETSFYNKYLYVDINYFKFLNNNPFFLKLLCYNNILSPFLSLLFPLLFLLIPFFVLILRGNNISFYSYFQILKLVLQNHIIGKVLNEGLQRQPMLFIYLLLYFYSIYMNFLVCYKFFKNTKIIINNLNTLNEYIKFSLKNMNYFLGLSNNYSTYTNFNKDLLKNLSYLQNFQNKLEYLLNGYNNCFHIKNYFNNLNNIGDLMHKFYLFFENKELEESLLYSFGFNGYFNNLLNIKNQILNKKINNAFYVNKNKSNLKPNFISLYYPKYINENLINIKKNSINLDKNIILTGPNASGKTTFIKSILINLLLSQQIGFGCYKKLKFSPFSFFYCYINIPDTLGRDSLFQAEARRCKNILDNINKFNNDNHFIIFDELFSGTNPEEAIISGYNFLKHINEKSNLCYLLTTHFYKICIDLSKDNKIKNYNMKTNLINNELDFTYKIKLGINQIKGGLNVLKKLNFPKEIFNS